MVELHPSDKSRNFAELYDYTYKYTKKRVKNELTNDLEYRRARIPAKGPKSEKIELRRM